MGSRRAVRPSRSHARPSGGRRARGTALVLGAVTVTAGVGITLAAVGGEDDGRSDHVASSAADDSTGTVEPTSTSSSASPSATASASVSPSPSPSKSATPSAAKKKASPARTAEPAAETSSRAATGGAGGQSSGSGDSGDTGSDSGSGSDADTGAGTTSVSGGPEARVLALVNEERTAAGCSPLTENARLTRAADDYSDVMAASGVMSHTGPDGSTMASRVEAAGYQWAALGENIARGQADAEAVMDAWMNSSGHRANILNCDFEEIGIGVHAGDGGPWWTQDFGTGR
ncbi:CAP domain-containing protein [Streptomyces sp. ISL-12]|uniref:CAP domain-containing protein n=1 Tax=Streptomyces sp. ISL-12 TaxID=2819177 RepID=UPI001BEB113D|nr:CAP domain-containing protein [Streptomyces sp. ISL-12]MBT2410555.1 CAP domain-containing protein [Streptomyces sp. ISL-12]